MYNDDSDDQKLVDNRATHYRDQTRRYPAGPIHDKDSGFAQRPAIFVLHDDQIAEVSIAAPNDFDLGYQPAFDDLPTAQKCSVTPTVGTGLP